MAGLRHVFASCWLTLGPACGYASSYLPPADGRARAIYAGNQVVAWVPDAPLTCGARPEAAPRPRPPVVDARSYGAATPPRNERVGLELFLWAHDDDDAADEEDASGEAALTVALAAAALLVSSGVAIGLAVDPPEADARTDIDRVNRYNDDAREAWAACSNAQAEVLR